MGMCQDFKAKKLPVVCTDCYYTAPTLITSLRGVSILLCYAFTDNLALMPRTVGQ